ncbi:MAG: hypothetical protein JRN15_10810 [Nitrososphaerota archaeon]|nr:hypothetical protein [Nitrososphaerota archaeon]
MNNQRKVEFRRATKNTYRFQEKTFTDPVIGTLYVRNAAALLSKIEEALEG